MLKIQLIMIVVVQRLRKFNKLIKENEAQSMGIVLND